MRIETLRIQAFGPYVEEQCIDFAQLATHHLFLIKGATGAGKSALLDAITYALYGKSSGGERGEFERMRNRLASPKEKSFVDLHFTLKGHHYRFYREIAIGKKRNGEELYKVSVNGGEFIHGRFLPFFENCKATLLEKKAEELIGLNHAQFIQVMILPQGKFERLLVSRSEEKQEILKTLFQSERWEQICDTLSEQLKQRKEGLDGLQQRMQVMLASNEVASLEELDALSKTKQLAYQEALQAYENTRKEMTEALQQYEEQVQLHELEQRYQEAQQTQQQLQKQQVAMAKLKEQIHKKEAYQQLQPYAKAYVEANRRQEELHQRLEQSKQALAKTQEALQSLNAQADEMTKREENLQQSKKQQHHFEELTTLWEELTQLERQELQAKKQLQAILDSQKEQLRQIESYQQQEKKLQEEQEQLEQMRAQLSDLLQQIQAKKEWKQQLQRYEEVVIKLQDAQTQSSLQQHQLEQLILQETQTKEAHESAYQAYLSNSALLLSQLLEEGSPCPVCGSCHHPNIIAAKKQAVDLKELNQKKAAWEQISKERQKKEAWLKQLSQQISDLQKEELQQRSEAEKMGGLVFDERAYQQLQTMLVTAQKAQSRWEKNKIEEQTCKRQLNHLEQHLQQQEKEKNEAHTKCLVYQTQIQERKAQLGNHQNFETFQQEYTQLRQAISTNEKILASWEASRKQQELSESMNQATVQHLQEALQQQQLTLQQAQQDLVENNPLQLDIGQQNFVQLSVAKEKNILEQYEQACRENTTVIVQLQEQLQTKQLLDLSKIDKRKQTTEVAYQNALRTKLELEQSLHHLSKVQDDVRQLRKEYEEALLAHNRFSEFVKAMRGDTSIGIERYVLGIMLSSITKNANELLKKVHGGRYQIYRSDETSGRTRKFGLELSIYDTYSCSFRSVVSLSGGEKFLVSLALSLALSTVVQARSGGVVMEAMFIDEGFGSLDEQSIGDALQILSAMANTKAMIGIISHVELLKENIPYGIEVEKQRNGSTCHMLI